MRLKKKGRRSDFVKCDECGASVVRVNLLGHINKCHPRTARELKKKNKKELKNIKKDLKKIIKDYSREPMTKRTIKELKKILKDEPDNAEAWSNLGECYFDLERFSEAKRYFLKALKLDPGFRAAKEALTACNNVLADLAKDDWGRNDIPDLCELAYHALENELITVSKHHANKVLELDEENTDAMLILGQCLGEQRKYNEAKELFLSIVDKDPDMMEVNFELGKVSMQLEDYIGAKQYYEKFLNFDPGFVPAWHNLGGAYYLLGDDNKALRCFDKSVKLDPNYYMGWFSKHQILDKLGRKKEAERCLKKALALNPEYGFKLLASGIIEGEKLIRHKSDWDE